MKFMILMIPEVYQHPVPEGFAPPADAIERMGTFNKAMADAGILGDLNGLHPPSKGARITFRTGKPVVTDGPFAESKEVLGGYWFIDVPSREDAIAWMKKCPAEKGDVIEIRQIFGPEDFPG